MPLKVFKNTSMVASKGRPQRSEDDSDKIRINNTIVHKSKDSLVWRKE